MIVWIDCVTSNKCYNIQTSKMAIGQHCHRFSFSRLWLAMLRLLLIATLIFPSFTFAFTSTYRYSISNITLTNTATLHKCIHNPCKNDGTCVLIGNHDFACHCHPKYIGPVCQYLNPCYSGSPCQNGGTCTTTSLLPNTQPSFKCTCPLGFTASLCEVELPNVCSRDKPCANGGKCELVNDLETYKCVCAPGWRGKHCKEFDYCASQPCKNGAKCHSHLNGTYSCECAHGFRGPTCLEDIDECTELGESQACNNNGVCINTPGSYKCNCKQGFTGAFCKSLYVPCQENPCLNDAECVPDYRTSSYQCVCQPGFTGPNCEENIDDCGGHLCHNGATCIDGVNSYTCQCPPNYTGRFCKDDVDECSKFPHVCQNGATCANTRGGFSCICVNGWTGPTCAENIDDCATAPCFNGGTCIDRVGTYQCKCPVGKTGLLCHLEDACASNPCHAGAVCDTNPVNGAYICNCPTGFKGTDCTEDIDECHHSGSPCEHGGTCVNTPGSFRCDCAVGFDGTRCEVNINECDSNPCQNDGTCLDERGSYRCVCMPGYTGTHCETNIDECQSNPCQNSIVCTDLINNYACLCMPGFDGVNCERRTDHCFQQPCRNGGTCHNEQQTYVCTCADGFTGRNCETNINDCESNPCMHGDCHDSNNSFMCSCHPGYHGLYCQHYHECFSNPCKNGGICVDNSSTGYHCQCPNGTYGINCEDDNNECWSNPCENGGTCHNRIGHFKCECPPGFRGEICEIDIDECQSNPCANGGTCRNLPNAFKCDCPKGYYGSRCLSDVDECAQNPCEHGGTCEDDVNKFICHCPRGYTGRRCELEEDYCASNPCKHNGICYSRFGNYTCQCAKGFTGNSCEINIDDCASNPCINGRCIDLVNKFRCQCYPGFTGNYCEHDVDECLSNPCANGGVCQDKPNGFQCTCLKGYYGPRCERTSQRECGPDYCSNNGICNVVGGNHFACTCLPGYTGFRCDSILDPCSQWPCFNGGTCLVDNYRNTKCICEQKFGGIHCERRNPWDKCPDAEFCEQHFGDKTCNQICNNRDCLFDGYDCDRPLGNCTYDQYCAQNYGNGFCDNGCNNAECGWDGLDCESTTADQRGELVLITLNTTDPNQHSIKTLLRELYTSTRSVFRLKEIVSNGSFGSRLYLDMDNRKCNGENKCFSNSKEVAEFIEASRLRDTHSLFNQYDIKVDSLDKQRIGPGPAPNLAYIVIGLLVIIFVGFLVGVLYSNGRKKVARGITWFPEGFFSNQMPASSTSTNRRHANNASAAAAGGDFSRNRRMGLSYSNSIRSGCPDGQEMRQFKSREDLLDEKGNCAAIYEEPTEFRSWSTAHYEAYQPHDPMTPPLPTPSIDAIGPNGMTPLMVASAYPHVMTIDNPDTSADVNNTLMDLIVNGANVKLVCDKTKESSLHLAARYARADAAKRLIEANADCNAQDATGRTPLHTAIASDARGVFEILLRNRKSDLNARTNDGTTPLILAARLANEGMLEQLVLSDCNLNAADDSGKTALHWAASVNNVEAVRTLLQHGADRDAKTNYEETPLFLAAREGSYHCAKLLLDYNANRDITDHMDRLPRDVALERMFRDIVQLLDEHEPATIQPSMHNASNGLLSPQWSNTLGRNTLSRRKVNHQQQASIISQQSNATTMTTTLSPQGTLKKSLSPVAPQTLPPPPPPRNCAPMYSMISPNSQLSPNTPQPILLLGSSAPENGEVPAANGTATISHSGSISMPHPLPLYQTTNQAMAQQTPTTPQLNQEIPSFSYDYSPPNSMLTSTAMISPPSRPPPPYEDCFSHQQSQPIAVAPRHVMNNTQPPTPTATTAPTLAQGYNNNMMRWPTGQMMPHGQQVSQQSANQPLSYPTPSPDSWGSLSTSSPLSAHDWPLASGMDNLTAQGQMMANGNGNMMLSPTNAMAPVPGTTALGAPNAPANPRYQPSSTQTAVFI